MSGPSAQNKLADALLAEISVAGLSCPLLRRARPMSDRRPSMCRSVAQLSANETRLTSAKVTIAVPLTDAARSADALSASRSGSAWHVPARRSYACMAI